MFKSKAIITLVVIIAIAVFVVAAVSSVMTGGSGGYERPAAMQEDGQEATETEEPASDETDEVSETVDEQNETTSSEQTEESDQTADAEVSTETTEEAERAAEREAQALESQTTDDTLDAMTAAVDSATEAAVNSSEDVKRKADEAILAATEKARDGREEAEEMLDDVSSKAEEVVATNETAETEKAAETHIVTAQGLVYNPLVVKIQPGDTVAWRNMSTHDTQSLEGLIPEGAEMWHSPMSKDYRRTFEQEGIYVYKCTPHFGAGMGGAIIVGEPVNLEQIKQADAKGAAKRLVSKAVQEAEDM